MAGLPAVSAEPAVIPLCVVLTAHVSGCLEPNGHLPLFVFKLSNVQIELEAAGGRNIITTMVTSSDFHPVRIRYLRRQR